MEKQTTFSDIEYGNRKKKTHREIFLETMEAIVPWTRLNELIKPHYYKNKTGRPSIGIEIMLRMYFLQIWFNLSDEATEDGVYDSRSFQEFLGINFIDCQAPDKTTLMNFRHLLERANLAEKINIEILKLLEENKLLMHGGTIVDATIINAPKSTKNENKARDPEMKSTRKGNQWYFGMKIHTGVDAGSGAVVAVEGTAANMHDITQAHKCFREDDEVRYGDAGYLGIEKRSEIQELDDGKEIEYIISKRPKSRSEKHKYAINWEKQIEKRKSSTRCKVEYPYYAVKNIFGCKKAIYRGIDKNLGRFRMAFASANLYMFASRLPRATS